MEFSIGLIRFLRFSNVAMAFERLDDDEEGKPLFVAADVCRVLEIGNPSDAVSRLDADDRTLVSIEGASNGKGMSDWG